MNIGRILRNTIGTAMLAGALMLAPQAAPAAVYVRVGFAPPLIPIYAQPLCPGDGYIWTPGYWAYGDEGYYWVDGAWVMAPYVGALWTPGYWGWGYGGYFWNAGYWGRTVGYYGGINYGFGYFGVGFYGGYWGGGHFYYNTAYGHFGSAFHGNVYTHSVAGVGASPGGTSFARTNASYSQNRGSGINGASVHGVSTSYGQGVSRSYTGSNSYTGQSHSYSSASSAPHANYSGGGSTGGGGGYHGGSGGGGGSRGGGGGGHR
jgi:WXXGXW repeat (2 copies)